MSDDETLDRELIPPELTSQERQLINLLRDGPAVSKDPRFDVFRIEISHESGVWAVVTGGNCGPGEAGVGATFADAWDEWLGGDEDDEDDE